MPAPTSAQPLTPPLLQYGRYLATYLRRGRDSVLFLVELETPIITFSVEWSGRPVSSIWNMQSISAALPAPSLLPSVADTFAAHAPALLEYQPLTPLPFHPEGRPAWAPFPCGPFGDALNAQVRLRGQEFKVDPDLELRRAGIRGPGIPFGHSATPSVMLQDEPLAAAAPALSNLILPEQVNRAVGEALTARRAALLKHAAQRSIRRAMQAATWAEQYPALSTAAYRQLLQSAAMDVSGQAVSLRAAL